MILEEIFEQAVSVVKLVWQKRGEKITRKEVSRVVAMHGTSRDDKDASHAGA